MNKQKKSSVRTGSNDTAPAPKQLKHLNRLFNLIAASGQSETQQKRVARPTKRRAARALKGSKPAL